MSRQPYTDYDLPTKHLSGEFHFIPPKARDKAEIERRKKQPAGTLLAEYQHSGLSIVTIMLGILEKSEDIESAAEFIVPAGLNTSWYSKARHAKVMRRRLKLARLATADPEQRPSSYMLHHEATDLFGAATERAKRLVTATRHERSDDIAEHRKKLMYGLGHASLVLDSVSIGEEIGWDLNVTDFELQDRSRERAKNALERARIVHGLTGAPLSIAGFADYDSDISVLFRKNASDLAVDAYEEAFQSAAIAA